MSKLFWIGVALLLLGSGPLLMIVAASSLGLLSDPNPNPIGPGLLFFFTFWPGVVLTVIGLARRRRTDRLA
ncbi:MAG: hypothetical protein ACJ8IR_00470 [Alphaproteobacteria bacterium]|jgi:hypothetical protein